MNAQSMAGADGAEPRPSAWAYVRRNAIAFVLAMIVGSLIHAIWVGAQGEALTYYTPGYTIVAGGLSEAFIGTVFGAPVAGLAIVFGWAARRRTAPPRPVIVLLAVAIGAAWEFVLDGQLLLAGVLQPLNPTAVGLVIPWLLWGLFFEAPHGFAQPRRVM